MSKLLEVPEEAITPWLSVTLGSSWIIDKELSLSEVELSMTFKSLRKLISISNKNMVRLSKNNKLKHSDSSSIFTSYALFNALHQTYYESHTKLQPILSLLSNAFVFDLGISRKRFFRVLPSVLAAISPQELETMFALNSIYRILVAKELALRIKHQFFIRGSLLLFHARPFGIGYNANFLGLDSNQTEQTIYNQATGSDIDIRIKDELGFKQYKQQIQQCQKNYPNIIIEVAKQQNESIDVVFDISQGRTLIDTYLMSPVRIFVRPIPIRLKSLVEIRRVKQQNKINPTSIKFTEDIRHKLFNSFCHVLKTKGANDETIEILGIKFSELLIRAKMETDFYCGIKRTLLWEAYKTIFRFSGYRFDTSEMRNMFTDILTQATT